MNSYFSTFSVLFSAICALAIGVAYTFGDHGFNGSLVNTTDAASTAVITLPFTYPFTVDGRLEEAGNMSESSSPYWWVNSGGFMDLKNGLGKTNQGNLPNASKWQKLYARGNPTDTDNGFHPQNIFRLLLRTKWEDTAQQVYLKINTYNLSISPNRAASNGVLLMSNYLDQNNLYYAGLRVDGYAVIKKKKADVYYTMAYKPVINTSTYNRDTNPNLLPTNVWMGVKSEVKELSGGRISIKLYADIGKTGTWKLVAEAIDDGMSYGGEAITSAGYVGLRSDFMDLEFDDFKLSPI